MHADKFVLAVWSLVLAAVLWILVFLVRPLNFWAMLGFSTLLLLVLAISINREKFAIRITTWMLLLGLASGLFLYGLFYTGFQFTKVNPIFGEGISRVYDFRSGVSPLLIGLLLMFPIAPAEEIYWRGLIQRRFAEKFGVTTGFLSASAIYALVHLPTFNPPLVLTAFIGGLVWGYVYKQTGSIVPGTISHVVFDLLIFVIAPLT